MQVILHAKQDERVYVKAHRTCQADPSLKVVTVESGSVDIELPGGLQ